MKTIKMTVAQAVVKFLDSQYISFDREESKFVEGIFTIFGHGNVVGLGQALDENPGNLKVHQGRNEQGMALAAMGFAKQNNRKKIYAATSSVGPGAANMLTAAACATANNIPLLLLPGDVFSTRQPDPVLQQIEQPHNLSISTNDAFRPVCKYWDRVTRPEQLMSAMINAMRVLTDMGNTGAVCVALPQDVQGEVYDFPETFFKKRVHKMVRQLPSQEELEEAVTLIKSKKKPLIICGGGVKYSEAGKDLLDFANKFNIPFAETQAGKSAISCNEELNLGGIGVTGNLAANMIARDCDLVIGVGTRFTDFTTGSKSLFKDDEVEFLTINTSRFDASKLDAVSLVGDAKLTLEYITNHIEYYKSGYENEIQYVKQLWKEELNRLNNIEYTEGFEPEVEERVETAIEDFIKVHDSVLTQTRALGVINEALKENSIIVGAAGSLPGDLQRVWQASEKDSYHMEYGYSCMGYEIAASLGAKLAKPEKEVYAMVGDGSYLMLHTELVTAIQEKQKINLLLFDNCGFGCINNLQMGNGIGSLCTEFRYRNDETNKLDGDYIGIDFAKVASGYGAKTYTVKTVEELKLALEDSKKQTLPTLIDIKVLPKTMTHGYDAWWHVGIAGMSKIDSVVKSFEDKKANLNTARQY
ncbi:3D-(3,5/4)-trihydroxycyclohexane-1,2-dione acylhydrolase (decyclizing) [Romboutsia weinsteinii]|uniref:3D-(3,5/4)-trihydroxycyclohexane-1,2-dione hydrolase n=1 Tax=Romboutsia weinsteinii TaxID=2020949 RepID=A0A371J5X4_9FIRM|nr:3D-(3,5/4)-trihydroxycyclohexane-1,2-dione acylhydrolase (decyclizing) [Romboutsia weinsteinii]RDY28078.1 3D-(3,5/4)-trihydroxycyclohexane-1,2-dione acylhydrolase (decyclizing) [Romboutsia weinsteinii]